MFLNNVLDDIFRLIIKQPSTKTYMCPNCNVEISYHAQYCYKCYTSLRWI